MMLFLRSPTFIPNPRFCFQKSQSRSRSYFLGERRCYNYLINKTSRGLSIHSSFETGAPLLPDIASNSWTSFIIGALVTVIIPFLSNKWGPLLKLTEKVEAAVETADNVVEVIEDVAEKVEKLADEISEGLPQGGKIRGAVEFVESAAKEIAKDAHFVDEILDKVEEIEEEVESFIVNDQTNKTPKQVNDQN